MNEIRDLKRDDRIILWQYRGLNVQDGHAGVVIREVDRLGKQSVMVQLDGIDDPFELTDVDYFDKLPISFKKAEHFEYYKNIPAHYSGQTDVIEFTRQQFTEDEWIASMKFNIIKYATRLGRKDALDKELDKIIDYAQRLKEGL
ncbi:DUF3310 domain-containing protein [Staphylococcus simulans]|uniref:DUF3310 domain-containing protein n=1 Tax=Staphylococcus simulans TaxID=1286 RepID=UPI0028A4C062|nr:DUF3310 domain-containing protein [Staphylococcus simulans]MDT4011625.1 DUF3310 domain-containing protein [Staphylococcus simulans]